MCQLLQRLPLGLSLEFITLSLKNLQNGSHREIRNIKLSTKKLYDPERHTQMHKSPLPSPSPPTINLLAVLLVQGVQEVPAQI